MVETRDNLVLAGLWLAVFTQIAALSIYSPLITLMRNDLGFTFGDFGLMATAFYIPYTALQLVFGNIAGRGHIRALMLPGMGMIIVSTALLGAIANLPEALLLRGVAGAAAAMLFVPSLLVINRRYPGRTNAALGMLGTGVSAGALYISLFAPTLGSWLGWRLTFLGLMLPTLAVWVAIYLFVHDFTPVRRTGAAPTPAFPTDVLKNRTTWLLGYTQFARVGTWVALLTFLPSFFASALGYSVVTAGAALTILTILAALSSVLGGRLATTMGSNAKVTVVSVGVMAVPLIGFGLVPHGDLAWVLAAVLGLAVFLAFGPQFTLATQLFSEETLGFAMGLQLVLANMGSISVPFLFGYLRDVTGAFSASWELCGALCVGAAFAGAALVRTESEGKRKEMAPDAGSKVDLPSQPSALSVSAAGEKCAPAR